MSIDKLAKATAAFEASDFTKSEKLFAEIEATGNLNEQQSAHIAYTRGEIAEQDVRLEDAAQYYASAAHLAPNFKTLIRAQKLAHIIGDYESALSFGLEAQKTAITEYGEESAEYANSINNLGGVYQKQENYEKAEELYQQALDINKKIFGDNHPATAYILNNLGGVYQTQEQYKKAEPLLHESFEIRKNLLGEDHPDTAMSLNNLAGLYQAQGQYKKAGQFFNQALAIHQDVFGEKHPETANSLNNLGVLYDAQGRHKDAEPLLLQALYILESTLGADHPTTELVKSNYESLINKSTRVAANSTGAPAH